MKYVREQRGTSPNWIGLDYYACPLQPLTTTVEGNQGCVASTSFLGRHNLWHAEEFSKISTCDDCRVSTSRKYKDKTRRLYYQLQRSPNQFRLFGLPGWLCELIPRQWELIPLDEGVGNSQTNRIQTMFQWNCTCSFSSNVDVFRHIKSNYFLYVCAVLTVVVSKYMCFGNCVKQGIYTPEYDVYVRIIIISHQEKHFLHFYGHCVFQRLFRNVRKQSCRREYTHLDRE